MLGPRDIELVAQARLGIGDADEPHATFVENALAKAFHAARASGLPALADDSGICVDALSGAPGVRSARFAGEPRSDERNNAQLLRVLSGHSNRRAHYFCVIVLVRHTGDPCPLIADASWDGEIAETPRGVNGFGYDPYFYVPSLGLTAAELDPELKNRLSHRAKALEALLARLPAAP